MMRIATTVAVCVIASTVLANAAWAQDSSTCPPTTNVAVSHVGGKSYTLRITAKNNCTCRISFQACSTAPKPRCKAGPIDAGQTRDFSVVTTVSDPKANFNWKCVPVKGKRR